MKKELIFKVILWILGVLVAGGSLYIIFVLNIGNENVTIKGDNNVVDSSKQYIESHQLNIDENKTYIDKRQFNIDQSKTYIDNRKQYLNKVESEIIPLLSKVELASDGKYYAKLTLKAKSGDEVSNLVVRIKFNTGVERVKWRADGGRGEGISFNATLRGRLNNDEYYFNAKKYTFGKELTFEILNEKEFRVLAVKINDKIYTY